MGNVMTQVCTDTKTAADGWVVIMLKGILKRDGDKKGYETGKIVQVSVYLQDNFSLFM